MQGFTTPVQTTYDIRFQPGQVGQIAQVDNRIQAQDVYLGAVELRPGEGVYLETDPASLNVGKWVLPTNDLEASKVTHIVGYEITSPTSLLAQPVNNATREIVFPIDARVMAWFIGSVYVTAGADILAGQTVIFDNSTKKWKVGGSKIVALTDASDTELLAVRVGGSATTSANPPVIAGRYTWTGGGTTATVTLNHQVDVPVGAYVTASYSTKPTEASTIVEAKVSAVNTLEIELSTANTSNDAVISYVIVLEA